MKKLITIIAVSAMMLTLAACGKGALPNSQNAESKSSPKVATTEYFGKISEIVGNEIEFNLAKLPEMPEEQKPNEDGSMDAVAMVPATPAGSADNGGGAANRVEVEFTGESKSFIIPAGVEIKDPSGTVKQISDLKKGTMLSISVQEDGTVTEVILLG